MMTELFNRQDVKDKRRALRRALTPAESLLWNRLRDRQMGGEKWRRQHSAGVYFLDFYCPARLLAVELDGDSHDGDAAQAYDAARTEYLTSVGIRVLRFSNTDVYYTLDVVVEVIWAIAQGEDTSPGSQARHPLLPKGEG